MTPGSPAVPQTREVPLSSQQEAFLAWMSTPDGLRHPAPMTASIRVTDTLDPDLLGQALRAVVLRHEALRTVFTLDDGPPRARVVETCDPETHVLTAPGDSVAGRLRAARELACRERERPFDLARGPLVRAAVIEVGDRDQVLLLAVHHLVCDMWSMGVLVRDLALAYSALRTGREPRFGRLPVEQFAEIVARSRGRWPDNRARWEEALAGAPAGLDFFPGREPSTRLSPRAHEFPLPGDLPTRIRRTAAAHAVTPFMLTLAVWASVLSGWSGCADLVTMSPVSGRDQPAAERAVGCVFSSLLIRVDLTGRPEFGELLRRVRTATLAAADRQDYPYAEFQRRFPHAPCVGYYEWQVPPHFPGLRSEPFDLPPLLVADLEIPGQNLGVPHLSLFDQRGGPVTARLLYNADAFAESTIEQLAQEFTHFMTQVCDQDSEFADV